MKNRRCPHCKAELRDNLRYAQQGEAIYNLGLDKDGDLTFDLDDFASNDSGVFFCWSCGKDIVGLTEEEVIEILKENKETIDEVKRR